MEDNAAAGPECRVLHAIVGHKLPEYFTNAISSVLAMTRDDVIIVDNASGLPELIRTFRSLAAADPRVRLLLRDTNNVSCNRKVGGLYDAYNEVMSYALEQGYDYLHMMQNDMQLLWWDDSVMRTAKEIYAEYPECANIRTSGMQRYNALDSNIEYVKPKLARLLDYGLTDTGLYDLKKWRKLDMRFLQSERDHSTKYLDEGLSVFFHPLPAVAFIPWPAVVRNGTVVGREVRPVEPFLLRPLAPDHNLLARRRHIHRPRR